MEPFQDPRSPWYLNGLIHQPLSEIDVILLHQIEHRILGDPAMVLGKKSMHSGKLFIGHSLAPNRSAHFFRSKPLQPTSRLCGGHARTNFLPSLCCRLSKYAG
jgi:hypothetical protein